MRLTSPYRIIFLYPKYQQIVSVSSLSGIFLGVYLLYQLSMWLAAHLHISENTSLLNHPDGTWWLACVLTSMPFLFYGGVMATACLTGSYLAFRGTMSWGDFGGYVTQRQFPAHWFEKNHRFEFKRMTLLKILNIFRIQGHN